MIHLGIILNCIVKGFPGKIFPDCRDFTPKARGNTGQIESDGSQQDRESLPFKHSDLQRF